jgi:predicted nucleotidyltransferase
VSEKLSAVLGADERIAYAILFGSKARGGVHPGSDTDVAVGLMPGTRLSVTAIGDLVSRLEAAAGGAVDLVVLDKAGPGLAYRVFREGRLLCERDHGKLVERKARAILEYLDFRPVEEVFARAALRAAQRG